ncbi:MAG: patatin-like phospholipase family protein [Propionicimonas sp.]|uniref:patatin-like phospholipase family protein n=1 Tax=Propionicimonas sp. TaxID=1955623 RepID=UPI002B20C57B|nr:patatin-like phospholipase family protein [Propionicimonas sp.]MEA4945332.1 patatin-like phospholipase family protein [Propionicimonas sp.]MEA5118775.1 patatin-like phospholipase family protein [Propionicimonas sp.]
MDERVLCLGSGAVTGAAWQLGVLLGLADAGVEVTGADRLLGTSAGSLLAAHLGLGRSLAQTRALLWELPIDARVGPLTLARLAAAQVWPSRRHAVLWLGRRELARWSTDRAEAWVDTVSPGLIGSAWPAALVVTATDLLTGRSAWFTADAGVPLERAVAASTAMPGVFPPVMVDGRPHFDGALRSPANLDLADGCGTVLAIAPVSYALRRHRRPSEQARVLGRSSRVVLIEPDVTDRALIGANVTDPGRRDAALRAGRKAGHSRAAEVSEAWSAALP